MAPQTSIPVAANVLGTIGTAFGVSKIWTNYRTKNTEGLPGTMMLIWATCAVPFGAYSIAQNFNIPIQIQPQCFGTFCLISWAQTLIYHDKWPVWKATTLGLVIWVLFGGAEAALILTLRPLYLRGVDFPMIILGVIASILLAVGLFPPYVELWKRRGRVIGINWVFLTIDWLGAFFSLMALVAQNTFDILGGVLYIICIFLEAGIFISHFIWMFRTRNIRAKAKEEGKSFEEVIEGSGERGFEEREIGFWRRKRKVEKVEEGNVDVDVHVDGQGKNV